MFEVYDNGGFYDMVIKYYKKNPQPGFVVYKRRDCDEAEGNAERLSRSGHALKYDVSVHGQVEKMRGKKKR